ncbi:integral membrane protein [Aspergillus terreus]|uniref:Integral membrane protein n=1 Tax=Aspergillus terreus TaxID=33178 RepID=A0A5M3Z2N4_ASPTE|nr:hypothetical protein ATETN484_0008021600 [Aspergillus terreus]GFF21117.1 integral membrane protein [Aspergillus terreus]
MAVPPIAKATLQAALINAGSNMLAQGIKAYKNETPFELDLQSLFYFTTYAFISSPLMFLWGEGLEKAFPGSVESERTKSKTDNDKTQKPRLNVKNTVVKITIDQTVGAVWNTVLFIATLGLLRGEAFEAILDQIRTDFWPMVIAGLKLWPLVSIMNFTVVPVDQRLLVGSLFGVVWAVYLSLVTG